MPELIAVDFDFCNFRFNIRDLIATNNTAKRLAQNNSYRVELFMRNIHANRILMSNKGAL